MELDIRKLSDQVLAQSYRVLLNGELLDYVLAASEEHGYAITTDIDGNNQQTLYGVVRFITLDEVDQYG